MPTQRIGGYTLIELLITLSIAAILGALSISGFSHLVAHTQQYTAVQNTVTSLNRIRLLAVNRNERVSLCSFTADEKCSADWNGKYLVGFIDTNKNHKHDNGEEIIFQQEWNTQIHLRWDDRFTNTVITYQPNGTVVSNGTLYLSDNKDVLFSKLIVNNYGRFRFEKP